jgi:hypothetical protein
MIRIMLILSRIKRPRPWFDSAPGHQETLKPPSGGFLFGLAGQG